MVESTSTCGVVLLHVPHANISKPLLLSLHSPWKLNPNLLGNVLSLLTLVYGRNSTGGKVAVHVLDVFGGASVRNKRALSVLVSQVVLSTSLVVDNVLDGIVPEGGVQGSRLGPLVVGIIDVSCGVLKDPVQLVVGLSRRVGDMRESGGVGELGLVDIVLKSLVELGVVVDRVDNLKGLGVDLVVSP